MSKQIFEIELPGADADRKMQAVTVLLAKLTTLELEKLAHIVKHDPVKTALAKKALGV